MSRRGYDDYYDERERDYYSRRPRTRREEVEIDIERERVERRPAPAASLLSENRRGPRQPDFLREDYGRDAQGPLVIREVDRFKEYQRDNGRTDISVAGSRRRAEPPALRGPREEIIIQERVRDDISNSGRSRRGDRARDEDFDDRRSVRRDAPRTREVDEERIVIRDIERAGSPPPRRKSVVNDDVYSRRSDSRPPARREVERERIIVEDVRPPEPELSRQEIVIRERAASPGRSIRGYRAEEEIMIKERDREYAPRRDSPRIYGPPIAHEREEFIFRKRREPSPPSDYEREQIIIRRRDPSPPPREVTPSPPSREPSPGPIPPMVPKAPTVVGSVRDLATIRDVTSVRDAASVRGAGREIARVPSPDIPPLYRPPIIQHIYTHHHHIDHGLSRARHRSSSPSSSSSAATEPAPLPILKEPEPEPEKAREETLEVEIKREGVRAGQKFYEKEVIIERERDPIEAARQEVDQARRRSVAARPEVRRDSVRPLRRDMWTEVTKDLVSEDAIREAGYGFEESSNHFYVMEYLKYEDVVRLVEASERIRNERARERKWRAEEFDRASATGGRPMYEERDRIVEREYIHEVQNGRRGSRYR